MSAPDSAHLMATQKGVQHVWSLLLPEALAELGSVTALCGLGPAFCGSTLQSVCTEEKNGVTAQSGGSIK